MKSFIDSEMNQISLDLLRQQRIVIDRLVKQVEDLKIELAGHQPVRRHLTTIKNFSYEMSKRKEGFA